MSAAGRHLPFPTGVYDRLLPGRKADAVLTRKQALSPGNSYSVSLANKGDRYLMRDRAAFFTAYAH